MDNYLLEAFQRLKLMEDDFDLSVDKDKVDELKAFIADDVDEIPEEPIIDVEADDESELQDNYIGKVILECDCCHSRIYKDEEEVFIDEESGLANIDEQCPVCNNSLGFTVIGKIEPFNKDREIDPEKEEEIEELPADDIEIEEEEVEESFSLRDRVDRKHLTEECKVDEKGDLDEETDSEAEEKEEEKPGNEDSLEECSTIQEEFEEPENTGVDPEMAVEEDIKEESLTEDFKEVEIKTEDQKLEMTSDDNGKVTVTTEPITEEEEFPADDIPFKEEETEETGEEEIVPLEPEEEAEIEANEPEAEEEQAESDEETEMSGLGELSDEEEPVEEDEEEIDIEDFEEEPFDEMGESYMRKVYSNVTGYKTTKINESNGSVIVEGLISFNSGATKPTRFVFDNASFSKRGKLVLEGYNKTFSKANKSFIVRGSLTEKKFMPESMIYNYKVKQLNESTGSNETLRVYGRIKKK